MKLLRLPLIITIGLAILFAPRVLTAQNTGVKEEASDKKEGFTDKKEGETYKEYCHRELRATFGFNSPVGGKRGGSPG